ncbi:MAG: hypothetical protein JNM86_15450 [Phycisphaerae bacterium]|nr:hypothetical protein [Phycisphaerae bacterium]MBN8596185.1 hypothetical protein [Planctomycetota bacterium]
MNTRSGCWAGLGACVLVAGGLMIGAGEPASTTPGSPEAAAAPTGVPAVVTEAEFLAGRWQGAMGKNKDSFVEETWSAPHGRNVIGMFRWNKPDGTSTVQELLTITEEQGTLLLRLRHQSASGVAWEEKDKPQVYALAEKTPTLLRFDALRDTGDVARCRYTLKDGKLLVDVEFAAPSAEAAAAGKKPRAPLNFELARVPL